MTSSVTFTRAYAVLALAAAAVAGCGDAVPEEPNWSQHVRPILAANCTRCHSVPAQGGAPAGFRLDKLDDTVLPDGRVIRGASTMAQFIAVRAGEMGEMPPDWPRSDAQRDTLINWFERAAERGEGVRPVRGNGRANTTPNAALLDPLPASADTDPVAIRYEVTDAERDLVDGVLIVDGNTVAMGLHNGRGEIALDPAPLAAGDHDVIARLTDDIDTVDVVLGTLTVAHASGNATPRARFVAPEPDALIADFNLPFEIAVEVEDADGPGGLRVDIAAFRGDVEHPVADGVPVTAGIATTTWDDTSALDDATNWRLRATVSDGTTTVIAESEPIIVSHAPSDYAFDDVSPIFALKCGRCHPGAAIPDLPHNFANYDDEPAFGGRGVRSMRGRIYRRVVQQRNMPPESAAGIVEDFEPLNDSERAMIENYLLGGAPP
jgi:hypothetical protein